MKINVIIICLFSFLLTAILIFSGCTEPSGNNPNLSLFGFVGIDCFYDDPLDDEIKTNYVDEVAGFTNIAHFCVLDYNEEIIDRISYMNEYNIKPIVAIRTIFVDYIDDTYFLLENYQERWDYFISINEISDQHIAAFYLPDEPYLNGLSYNHVNQISQTIKTSFPTIPILLVEAYTALNIMIVPDTVDWVGFDQYDVINPNTDMRYNINFQKLLSKANGKEIILIMDTQWRPYYQEEGGIVPSDMEMIAQNYYNFSKNYDEIIGIIGYLWPGGLDLPEQLGARNLPDKVKETYRDIGLEILNK